MEQNYSINSFKEGDPKMLDEKKLKEAEKRVKQYQNDGMIKTKERSQYVDFFPKMLMILLILQKSCLTYQMTQKNKRL